MIPVAARKGGRTTDREARQPAPAQVGTARRPSRLRPLHQGLGVAACGGIFAAVCLLHFWMGPHGLPLFLFVSALTLLAVLLPVTGPRGLRVGLLPAVGLAGLLLLAPGLALLTTLLANTAFALSRPQPLSRRMAHERGASLGLALLAGGVTLFFFHGAEIGGLLTTMAVYAFVFLGSRRLFAERLSAARDGRSGARQGWRVEAATLAASAPTAFLMALVFPHFGLLGLSGLAALLGLLGMVAHFGFEAAALRDQVWAMETLSAVTVSQTSPTRVTSQFLQLSRKLVSCDRAVLWLTEESDIRLKRALGGGPGAEETPSVRFGEGLIGRAAEQRRPLFVRDGACDPRSVAEERLESGRRQDRELSFALLLVPLVAGNQTLGVIQFERDAPGMFTRRDLSRIQALASQAAATLANVRAHRDIYSQAVTDALTGLHNRRHMQTVLADECRRAQRYGHPLSVIMLDVDGFKSYNDTYGHVQGDVLLRTLAGILQASVRGADNVGRFGGEEFIVVLPETPADEAYQAAERLRLAVACTSFPGHADAPDTAICKTISLGLATFPNITEDVEALVALADGALYRAKRGGRNQTVQAEPEAALLEPD